MTMKEFRRWSEYETIEPFGDYWLIQQNARLCARVFNDTRGKGERRYRSSDFLPMPQKPPKPKKLSQSDLNRLHRFFTRPGPG